MAINWGSLIFGGVDSSEYGVYISGEGVYNAPERAVEMVDVPGRNGAVIIDQGHWNNIEVVYRAGVFGANQAEMSEKLSAFRNAILSQTGYQRLSDSYHPEEYRMGAYVAGLEVSPTNYNRHGEFELVFNCKPQRYITEGEVPIPLESGKVIQNPTEYETSPLLEFKGYGKINLYGQIISVSEADTLGDYVLYRDLTLRPLSPIVVNRNLTESGDRFTIGPGTAHYVLVDANGTKFETVEPYGAYTKADITTVGLIGVDEKLISHSVRVSYETTYEIESEIKVYAYVSGTLSAVNLVITIGFVYSPTTGALQYTEPQIEYESVSGYPLLDLDLSFSNVFIQNNDITVHSTKSIEAADKYIDLDSGESYGYLGDALIDLDRYVYMGSDLPTLKTGNIIINYDPSITEFKITPRWWKL